MSAGDESGGYFDSPESRDAFRDDLAHLLVEQKMAFNSPVWFNVGVQPKPQCSACFINSVQDSMESILDLAKTEGMLFKWGSGTGTNFSTLRGSHETLSGGGIASGPLSFMKGFDAFAGVIKCGGKTRRAAKMVILNVDHPDIVEFIECKAKEEHKAHVLIEQGYDTSIDGEAYSSIFFQNANNSVRVTDEFMQAVEEDRDWWTRNVADGSPVEKLQRARTAAAHRRSHLAVRRSRHAVRHHRQPLAHLQEHGAHQRLQSLLGVHVPGRFGLQPGVAEPDEVPGPRRPFDVEAFRHAVDSPSPRRKSWWTTPAIPPRIAENSHNFRPLGLGYANLGALLMSLALPYDCDGGRDMAARHHRAHVRRGVRAVGARSPSNWDRSPRYADQSRAHAGRDPHAPRFRCARCKPRTCSPRCMTAARKAWDDAVALGEKHGYRNAQVTVLAPTGTIGFMMDCDTTGIEPDLALVKYKKLVGGGVIKIVNNTVPQALMRLGYSPEQASQIVSHIDQTGTIEGAPGLKPEHLPVFDCSLAPAGGGRSISWRGHLKMMAAMQPFLSGAISKTINMPEESTVEDIMQAYIESLEAGAEGRGHLPRQFQAQPAALGRRRQEGDRPRRRPRRSNSSRRCSSASSGASCRASGSPSRTSSPSAATKATSPWACMRTASPARSSSRWPRKARRFPASWTASRFPFPSACSTACR